MLKYRIKKVKFANGDEDYFCFRKRGIFWCPLGTNPILFIIETILCDVDQAPIYGLTNAISRCKEDAKKYCDDIKAKQDHKVIKVSINDFTITEDGNVIGDIK